MPFRRSRAHGEGEELRRAVRRGPVRDRHGEGSRRIGRDADHRIGIARDRRLEEKLRADEARDLRHRDRLADECGQTGAILGMEPEIAGIGQQPADHPLGREVDAIDRGKVSRRPDREIGAPGSGKVRHQFALRIEVSELDGGVVVGAPLLPVPVATPLWVWLCTQSWSVWVQSVWTAWARLPISISTVPSTWILPEASSLIEAPV